MKKLILVALLLISGIGTMQAQLLAIGVKGGVNFSNYTGSVENVDFNTVTGYHAGLVLELKLFGIVGLQPEFLYSTQGSDISTATEDFKNELGYFSIPVMFKLYLLPNRFSLDFGPQASFLVSEKDDFDIVDTNTFDVAAAGGLTFKFKNGIFLSGRYVAGLTEPIKETDVKNSSAQFSLGYMF
jgi:hypothetical protein